ncbi:hypothetical protein J6590_100753 [Homalodisca vitripennis]|nr:hypothetical protein J6590_100753 [Homalodisca vitripennis]
MACLNAPRVTRKTIACPIIGVPKELSGLSLPTYEEILLCCLDENLDIQETTKLRKREERRAQLLSQESQTTFEPSTPSTSKGAISGCSNEKKKIKKNLPDVECDVGVLLPSSSTQMRSTLTTTSLMSDRFGVSDRATAAIATGVLHDLGIICDENMAK